MDKKEQVQNCAIFIIENATCNGGSFVPKYELPIVVYIVKNRKCTNANSAKMMTSGVV
jgi:hypothetical protein